jgi:hypothetical protein
LFIILPLNSVFGEDSQPFEIGRRGGIAAPDEGPFYKEELVGTFALPGGSRSTTDFQLNPKLDATAGVLRRGDEIGFIGSVGPGFAMGWREWPIFLVGGVRAALLGEHIYKDKNFGGRLQFIEDIGFNVRFKSEQVDSESANTLGTPVLVTFSSGVGRLRLLSGALDTKIRYIPHQLHKSAVDGIIGWGLKENTQKAHRYAANNNLPYPQRFYPQT